MRMITIFHRRNNNIRLFLMVMVILQALPWIEARHERNLTQANLFQGAADVTDFNI